MPKTPPHVSIVRRVGGPGVGNVANRAAARDDRAYRKVAAL